MSYYIVYSYVPGYMNSPTKYIEGIYTDLDQAKRRQSDICGEKANQGINGSLFGNGRVSFINVNPIGDCHVEMFTTSPYSSSTQT